MPTIKELLDQQKEIRENARKPKRKPGPKPKKVKDDASTSGTTGTEQADANE